MKSLFQQSDWVFFFAGFIGGFVRLCSTLKSYVLGKRKFSRRDVYALLFSIIITGGGVFLSVFVSRWLKLGYEQSIIVSYMAGYLSHNLFKYIDRKEYAVYDQLLKRIK